jgi:hypothetical protein
MSWSIYAAGTTGKVAEYVKAQQPQASADPAHTEQFEQARAFILNELERLASREAPGPELTRAVSLEASGQVDAGSSNVSIKLTPVLLRL